MLPSKQVTVPFLLRFALILTVYMIPWPGFGDAYGGAATAIGNLLVGEGAFRDRATLHFERPSPKDPAASATDSYGTELQVRSLVTGQTTRVPIDLRTLAFVPAAVFIALSVAAPIWQGMRGVTVLVAGIIALHAFLLVSIAAPLALLFSQGGPVELFEMSPAVMRILTVFYRSAVAPPGMAFAVPGGIWIGLVWLVPNFTLRPKRETALVSPACPALTTSEVSPVSDPSSAR